MAARATVSVLGAWWHPFAGVVAGLALARPAERRPQTDRYNPTECRRTRGNAGWPASSAARPACVFHASPDCRSHHVDRFVRSQAADAVSPRARALFAIGKRQVREA